MEKYCWLTCFRICYVCKEWYYTGLAVTGLLVLSLITPNYLLGER